jgi:hypothetical protein
MRAAVCSLLALALAWPRPARADGAFPDELQVFAPPDDPGRVVLSTNYGLITSDDDGASWSYVCEGAVSSSLVKMYGVGPARTYALTDKALLSSPDEGCTWRGLDLAPLGISSTVDVFGDPARDDHAFVITFTSGARGFDLYEIDDGGARAAFASGVSLLRGVEVSRSDPRVVYATRFAFDTGSVELLYSDDHGQSFTSIPHPELGAYYPGIAAVDPVDPATVYLRLVPLVDVGDVLAVSHDSGQSFTALFTAPDALSAFAVDVTHAFYAADRTNDFWYGDAQGALTRGTGPSVRCLAARAGEVYACGDAAADGFILGRSTDHGAHFTPVVTGASYQTAACAPVRAVCPGVDGGSEPDAGSPGPDDAGARDAGSVEAAPEDAGGPELDAGGGPGPVDAGAPGAGSTAGAVSGCGCASPGGPLGSLPLLAGWAARRRRRSTRPGTCTGR